MSAIKPEFELGTRIIFIRRSGVFRKSKNAWSIVEPDVVKASNVGTVDILEAQDGKINKSVGDWHAPGSGMIIGWIKRGIGESVSHSGPDINGEYDEGYFSPKDWVWLYVVKQQLNGMKIVYVQPKHITLQ